MDSRGPRGSKWVQALPARPLSRLRRKLPFMGAQLVKKGFDKLVDGEASSPARCRGSNLRFEPSAVSPRAKPENPKGFQPPCHPHQSPLKIEDFSGAKPARKRFFLWKMGFTKTAPCPPCLLARPSYGEAAASGAGHCPVERVAALSSSPFFSTVGHPPEFPGDFFCVPSVL